MIKTKNAPKLLLVEGKEDERLIPELMEQNNIDWSTPPVMIKTYEGYTNLIDKYISVQLKQSNLTHLGLVVDADEDCSQR